MKLSIERRDIASALGRIAGIVEPRTTIPILSNVLLTVDDDGLAMRVTDLERQAVARCSCKADRLGAVTVPAGVLDAIVRKVADGVEIDLDSDAATDVLNVRAGRSRFALRMLPADDFPSLDAGDAAVTFTLPASDLSRLFGKTRFAVSTDQTRYYLNGVYFHIGASGKGGADRVLRCTSTDGHRLAQVDGALPGGAADMPGVIIPRKTVNELCKLADASTDEVKVSVSLSRVTFEIGSVTLTSKLIDGTFPDYQRVIPTANDRRLVVDRASFISAVDLVATMTTTERAASVRLRIDDGRVHLSTSCADGGSAAHDVDVEYAAEPLDIGFNAKYLAEVLSQLDGDNAALMLGNSGSPALISDPDGAGELYVLMPMRVGT